MNFLLKEYYEETFIADSNLDNTPPFDSLTAKQKERLKNSPGFSMYAFRRATKELLSELEKATLALDASAKAAARAILEHSRKMRDSFNKLKKSTHE